MGVKKKTYAPANYESVAEALVGLYGEKVREAEKAMLFDRFTTSLLSDAELLAKPMVLLLGQYSSGKTTFIRYLAGSDFPGIHIGPEPTTDGFAALMDGSSPTPIPGNAATSSKQRPFRALSKFGAAFLNKFCISELKCDLTKQLTLIDTPGILAGSKQTMGRNYDFASIVKWFAERSDMILLLFDAHKIDISDELKSVIESLHQHDEKMRLVLNKADALTTEEIMHVYGGTMWFLGKVFKTPEVKRSYMSSFWEKPLKNAELERFMTEERERLLSDLYALPQGARTRKVNEFIKRVRAGRAHCLVFNHLRKEMPTMMGKAKAKERLLANLPDEFRKISQNTNVPLNDFPNPYDYQKLLATYDFSKLPKASKEMLQTYEDVIERDLRRARAATGGFRVPTRLEASGRRRAASRRRRDAWCCRRAGPGSCSTSRRGRRTRRAAAAAAAASASRSSRAGSTSSRRTAAGSAATSSSATRSSSTTASPRTRSPAARSSSRAARPRPTRTRSATSLSASRRRSGPTTSPRGPATTCPTGCSR